jgi:hypothetical protein
MTFGDQDNRTLLIVDDDEPFRTRLMRAFSDRGFVSSRVRAASMKRWVWPTWTLPNSPSSICGCPANQDWTS